MRAGLSTIALASRLGWSQSKVSRIELAGQSAAVPDVRAWAEATGAEPAAVDELVAAAEQALISAVRWDDELAAGLASKQVAISEIEKTARRIREFQVSVVPGLLQTFDYARHLFRLADPRDEDDVLAGAASRMDRQQILYDQGRQFEFVIAEPALWWRPGPKAMLAGQLAHITTAISLPNVDVKVISRHSEAVAFYHSFDVLDEDLVTMEVPTRELHLRDPEEVASHLALFERLKSAALDEDGTRALLAQLQRELLTG